MPRRPCWSFCSAADRQRPVRRLTRCLKWPRAQPTTDLVARSSQRKLLVLILAGTAVRLAWAHTTSGVAFDIASYRIAARTLLEHNLGFYGAVNPAGIVRWPYPPGYLPWTLAAHGLAPVVAFRFVVALPAIAADAALAFLVARALGRRGASEAASLGAACLVAFGPIFALTSGYHGQIDSLAILPTVIAFDRWERGGPSRAVTAGALIGLAASIKTPVGLVLLALLPTARDPREAGRLIVAAAAPVAVILAPFALAVPTATLHALNFVGVPGEGGLSLVVQPSLSRLFVGSPLGVRASGATLLLHHHGALLVAALLVAVTGFAWRRKAAPGPTVVALFLTVFAFGAGFTPRYAIWLLPYLLIEGRLRAALCLQLALLGPVIAVYAGPLRTQFLLDAYVITGVAIWAALVVWWLRSVAPLIASPQRSTSSGRPTLPWSSTARTDALLPVAGTESA
jgi:Glycosyltransferase family 87